MPNIKPISDLRSYSAVLEEVAEGSPVFLTKNGRGRYAILDMNDYERYEAEKHCSPNSKPVFEVRKRRERSRLTS